MASDVAAGPPRPLWDLPTRIVHWSLVVLLLVSWLSAGENMQIHRWSGYAIVGLLVFRLWWGVAGGSTARFTHFLKGPGATLAYMRTRSTGSGGDFARTERQRKVVSQLFDKCRDLSLMELVGLYNSVSSGMKMSLSAMDILSVLSQGYALMTSGADFVEYRIPQDGTYSYGQVGSSSVLDVRWKTNRTRFHALLDNEP